MTKKPKAKMVWPQRAWAVKCGDDFLWAAKTRKLIEKIDYAIEQFPVAQRHCCKIVRVEIRPAKGAKR